jgi:hypothetical protein
MARYNWIMDVPPSAVTAEVKPLWSQDEAIAFEVARDAINAVMSIYTGQIAVEERKAEPDVAAIAGIAARLSALHQERTALHVKDHAAIARVRQEYGAFVRAWNARLDAARLN